MLKVRLFGTFDVKWDDKPVTISSRTAQSLFAYLILNAGKSYRREKLAGMFWPEEAEEKARAFLRHAIWRIRKAIPSNEFLLSDDIGIVFNSSIDYWLDADVLGTQTDIASADELIVAVSAYQGELLPGFYDEWVVLGREHLLGVYEQKMARLLELLEIEKRWNDILEWAEKWISFGQVPEAAYRYLMIAYEALGDPVRLTSTYERCRKALRALDLEPSEQTRALAYKRNSKINIPIPLTSFIGREKELQEVAELLSKSRLVTLTGSGGVGKTRLAIQVVADVLDRFPEGIWFLDLAPLSDPSLVPNTLANLLGLRESSDTKLSFTDLLINYFRSRTALVIFDNCEHLIESCAQLVHLLLTSCGNLSILATSREALRVSGEILYRVPSLEIPQPDMEFAIDELSIMESVRLFAERAATVSPTFAINQQNALAIAQICKRLDGIPLAIELAAVRTNMLTVEQILKRLADRFNLLSRGLRSALPRHQTLRAMIDWSYDLLTETERILFRRLAVFSGGWTLEAAEVVCGADGIESCDVLDVLSQLVNKSLVLVENKAGKSRYRRLETIGQFAREKLIESGEHDNLHTRHRDFFLSLAELAGPHLEGGRDLIFWFQELDTERENLRTALDWCRKTDQVDFQARMACALYVFWWRRGYFIEGFKWIEAPLSRSESLPKALVGKMLWMASRFAERRGEFTRAKADAEQAVVLCRELGDKRLLAMAMRTLALVLDETGEDEQRSQSLTEEAMLLYLELGDKHGIAGQLGNLAIGALEDGDYIQCIALQNEQLALSQELGDTLGLALGLLTLAEARLAQKDLDGAEFEFREALHSLYELGDKWSLCSCLDGLAAVANAHAHFRRAARLLGASEQLATLIGGFRKGYGARYIMLPAIESARANLPPTEFNTAWAEGRAMSLDQVVSYALRATAD